MIWVKLSTDVYIQCTTVHNGQIMHGYGYNIYVYTLFTIDYNNFGVFP